AFQVCPSVPNGVRMVHDFPAKAATNPSGQKWPAASSDYTIASSVNANVWNIHPSPPPTSGRDLMFGGNNILRKFRDVTDGLSNTLMIEESAGRPSLYQKGKEIAGSTVSLGAWAWANNIKVRGWTGDGTAHNTPEAKCL